MKLTTTAFLSIVLSWFPFAAIAVAQLVMIVLGHYNPSSDDFVPASFMPIYYVYLFVLIFISAMSTFLAMLYYAQTTRVLTKPLIASWVLQVTVWIVFYFVGGFYTFFVG